MRRAVSALLLATSACAPDAATSIVFELTLDPEIRRVEAWGADADARAAFPVSAVEVPPGVREGTIAVLLPDDTPRVLDVGLRATDATRTRQSTWSGRVTLEAGAMLRVPATLHVPDTTCPERGCPHCGDGFIDPGEACDDGANDDGDGCSSGCALEPEARVEDIEAPPLVDALPKAPPVEGSVCGDGVADPNEACDDGGRADDDGCSSTCTLERGFDCSSGTCVPVCGDGLLAGDEACDDGGTATGDGCSATCTVEPGFDCIRSQCWPICGDGRVVADEACDDGNTVNGDGCSDTCQLEDLCGDGVIGVTESCDDDNTDDGDGCSATCTIEAGFSCEDTPSDCEAICGDGLIRGDEECDDGNTSRRDGCNHHCDVENHWECGGEPSVCEED